jgi:chromosome segregation ATPase
MTEEQEIIEAPPPSGGGSLMRNVLLAIAGLYVLGSLYAMFDMHGRISRMEAKQEAAAAEAVKQARTNERLVATTEALGAKLGMTEKDLAARTAELQRQQKASESRLTEKQQKAIGEVSGEVAGVKSEVGGVKTDVATTRTELEATKAKLERTIGDLGLQSGLIARTREDLEALRRRGDRNYFEFTLLKGQSPTPISTVSLQLKKADQKKSKFTLNVMADDRTIEKKDKTMMEPLQFYTGRDRQLYELVVFTVEKNKVTGYLSTPKSAPAPSQ